MYSFGNSGNGAADVYLYDYGQTDNLGYLYTAEDYGSDDNYLYLYAFQPYDDSLVYYQGTYNPRSFYDFDTSQYLSLY